MTSNRLSILRKRLLIVEGKDEEELFSAILGKNLESVQVMPIGGKTKLSENLKSLCNQRGFETVEKIAVIRDADEDPDAALVSVHGSLRKCGLTAPSRELIFEGNNPSVAITVLPGNKKKGRLENIVKESLLESDEAACVEGYFSCLREKNAFAPQSDGAKSWVTVYLASKEDDFLRLGHAAQRGLLDFSHEAFASLHILIDSLCN
ncbi:MAG: DUF4435 domain-containing protein [Planctomycetes bacterium]|nr:DUF4435 domain-containing protein [Planctomycetota bacterium]